jgi:hypothetical protein
MLSVIMLNVVAPLTQLLLLQMEKIQFSLLLKVDGETHLQRNELWLLLQTGNCNRLLRVGWFWGYRVASLGILEPF